MSVNCVLQTIFSQSFSNIQVIEYITAELHKNWVENQWQQDFFGLNSQYVWRRSGEGHTSECLESFVKNGGGAVIVCSYISASGVGNTVETFDKQLIDNNFPFQHERDPKHPANSV